MTDGRFHCLSPASAYYHQRHDVAAASPRLAALREAIARPLELNPPQWAQWYAYVREYKPDLVIELGRAWGNSTAAIGEALYRNECGRLVSLCLTDSWAKDSVPKIAPFVEPDWFDRIDARVEDILTADFTTMIGDSRRVLLIWDAHGFDIAEVVLSRIMPRLQEREHFVIMHDISDLRYTRQDLSYSGAIWKGMGWVYDSGRFDSRLFLGWVDTIVDQAISAIEFLTRNRAELLSADHSFHRELGANPERAREMAETLDPDDWSMVAHWAYFSLNSIPPPYTFPKPV